MTISEEKESPQKRQESQKIQLSNVNKNYRKRLEMKEKENLKIQNYLLCMIQSIYMKKLEIASVRKK